MDSETIAYLAGAIDSDGCLMIRKSTYHSRVIGDASNPTYSERIALKQVTPQVPMMLKDCAEGGRVGTEKPSCSKNGRLLHVFDCTDRIAARLARNLMPYLRIKCRQAELLLELRKSKTSPHTRAAFWYAQEHPQWQHDAMLTSSEVIAKLKYSDRSMLSQAVRNGTLLALPWDHVGQESPRFPVGLVDALCSLRTNTNGHKKFRRPPQLIAWRQRLWDAMKSLNQIGLHGTAVNRREGCHAPK